MLGPAVAPAERQRCPRSASPVSRPRSAWRPRARCVSWRSTTTSRPSLARPAQEPLKARDRVLEALAAAGAELVVGGHVHQAGIAERREFEALEDGRRSAVVLATAPASADPGRAAAAKREA